MGSKNLIIETAIKLAEKYSYTSITRAEIALKAKTAEALISYYYGTMDNLRREIIKKALEEENLIIIAQGLIYKDPAMDNISKELKERALAAI